MLSRVGMLTTKISLINSKQRCRVVQVLFTFVYTYRLITVTISTSGDKSAVLLCVYRDTHMNSLLYRAVFDPGKNTPGYARKGEPHFITHV